VQRWISIGILAAFISACGQKSEEAVTSPASQPASAAPADSDPIQATLTHPDRLAGDAIEDEWRKPAEVLKVLDAKPGMRVLDYLSGGGYYTELLARIVGPQGQVIAFNNAPYLKYAAEKPAQRYGNQRLSNVAQLTTAPEDLPLNPESLDAALFVQSYHDLHWVSKDGSWPATDPKASLAKLATALKPGAVVVVVDHVAAAGSDPATSVDTLHRIDPDIIKRDFEAAGLKFESESDALRNSADDHTQGVFEPSIRHKTDQVVYRFVKGSGP
jgi:predicted methyltransferase